MESSVSSKDGQSNAIKIDKNMHSSCGRSAAVMIACMYMNICCFGMYSGLGVIYVELISDLDSPRSDAALVQSLYLGLLMGCGLLFTKAITKYDTGLLCIIIASTIAGLSVACGCLARNIGTVIVLVGVVAGMSASVNVISSASVINWMFVENRKFALSSMTVGIAIGQTILPIVISALVNTYFWNGTLLILGALIYLNCIPCGLLIHFSKQYFKFAQGQSVENNISFKRFLTDFACIFYCSAMFLDTLFGPVESWFIVDLAEMKGIEKQTGAILISVNGIATFIGMIACTTILKFYPNIRPEVYMCYGYLAFAASHLIIIISPVLAALVPGMLLRGASTGFTFAFLPSLQLELCGTESFPRLAAISYNIMGLGSVLGGYIGGYSVDVTGSYNLIFYIAASGALCGGICMILIHLILKRRRRERGQYQKL